MKKQYIFKDQGSAKIYLDPLKDKIKDILFKNKLPKLSKYEELETIGSDLEYSINKLLGHYNGVVGSNGYAAIGNASIKPSTVFRMNIVTKEREITIPIDFSIWVFFEYGVLEYTFSNIRKNEELHKEYFDYPGSESVNNGMFLMLEKRYDAVQKNYS